MLLVGTLLVASLALVGAWRRTEPAEATALTRFGLKTLRVAVIPAYLVMRIGAQWTESRENLPDEIEDSTWLGIGYLTADIGSVLILVSAVLSGIALVRMKEPT